ncbi:unnamed protein product [Danaus chrysippus]|uniref:(African queen) hypothetical protein n=1 Tax=Danaus chrysippus TaxID=151541 RepID=A0A8J2QM96_9NEOP|nr:unnamed protein product [Danaus chrysippus]
MGARREPSAVYTTCWAQDAGWGLGDSEKYTGEPRPQAEDARRATKPRRDAYSMGLSEKCDAVNQNNQSWCMCEILEGEGGDERSLPAPGHVTPPPPSHDSPLVTMQ